MKVSLLIAHYNKNECLPNTLYSIARQRTSFPMEVCFVDDCSDIDPKPIVDKFLPDAKYLRLEKNAGSQFVRKYCMDLMSKDSGTTVILSTDVIIPQSFGVELLCNGLRSFLNEKRVAFAYVRNTPVPKDLYLDFEVGVEDILKNQWNGEVYSGIQRKQHWYMFFSAIRLKDLKTLEFDKNNCDVLVDYKMRQNQIYPIYLPGIKGIHQQHESIIYPCKILKECPHLCYRKS